MKINSINSSNFEGARINIVANADNHANLNTLGNLYGVVENNKADIFEKYNCFEPYTTLNVYDNAGDFFVNPSQKGWISGNNLTNGDVQLDFLQTFVNLFDNLTDDVSVSLYTPGNHDFDGGDEMFLDLVSKTKGVDVIMSNAIFDEDLNPKNDDGRNIISKACLLSVFDDKTKPFDSHYALALGITIPSMDFYNPGLLNNIKFVNHSGVKDVKIEEKDLVQTFDTINNYVENVKSKFKNDVPVIILSHTGRRISEMIAKNCPDVDVILDGHGHTDETDQIGKTHILSLGQDNKFFKTLRIDFDDYGSFEITNSKKYDCNKPNEIFFNELSEKLERDYKADVKPLIINPYDSNHEPIYKYDKSIRWQNSPLANLLTSTTKDTLKKMEGYEDVDIMGLQSSIVRGGLKNGSSNLEVLKVFDGVSEDLAHIMVGRVSGLELSSIVLENIEENLKNEERNTIIHFSDIQIDKNKIKELSKKGYDMAGLIALNSTAGKGEGGFIKIRNERGDFVPLDYRKNYKLAIADKYLKKDDIEMPKRIRDRFEDTNETYSSLFCKYLKDKNYELTLDPRFLEERIIYDK